MLYDCFDGYHMGGRTWFGNGLIGIITIVIIAAILILLFKKDSSKTSTKDRALTLLDQKFVNGDITEEEYINKKKLISK